MSGVQKRLVKPDEDGMRLDRWFRSHFPDLTQGRLQKLMRKGEVRLDGGRVKADQRIAEGQTVRVPPLPSEPAKPVNSGPSPHDIRAAQEMVIYRDAEVLVVNKPPGLATQGGNRIKRHLDGMLPALQFDAPDVPRLVHRLDKDTSGVLVLGRSRKAAQWLTQAFRERETIKTYWALVAATPRPQEGTIDLRLAKDLGAYGERVEPVEEGGQKAITHYATLSHAGQRAAWLAMRPVTGRTHQLRVHAAAIGCPIIGDGKYGGEKAFEHGFIERLHLHARRIQLRRPGGGMLDVTAELPPHFVETVRQLGFNQAEFDESLIDWPDDSI